LFHLFLHSSKKHSYFFRVRRNAVPSIGKPIQDST
jgi:hypothetical protein